MPSEAQMAKFMYYIVKQLDVRSIDWNLVASDMEITNGHAARMRFARFKNQMEGTVPKTRAPRDKTRPPKAKRVKTKADKKEEDGESADLKLKIEGEPAAGQGDIPVGEGEEQVAARSPVVKPEPADEVVLGDADAPGELVDESRLLQHNTHVTSSTTYHLSPNRRTSIDFSSASSFIFSHDLMPQSMFMQSVDSTDSQGSMSQDLQMSPVNAFYDPFLFSQQQQMLVDGQGRLLKGENQWDASFC